MRDLGVRREVERRKGGFDGAPAPITNRRRTAGLVIAHASTDRTLAGVPLRVLTFEVEGRIVVFEHLFGERHAAHYSVGKAVEVWVDPDDANAIRPGR
jgi:hypothetical protein